jgi:hypothetical protein
MADVLSDVFSVYSLEVDSRAEPAGPVHPATMNLLSNVVLCEHLIVHGPRIEGMGLKEVCDSFGDVFNLVDLKLPPVSRFIPAASANDIDREFQAYALDYLGAAQTLGVYLGLAPERSRFLKRLLGASAPSEIVSQAVVSRADSAILRSPKLEFVGVDFSVPPVGEFVVGRARAQRVTLVDAAIEVRNSKHASAFRARCAEIDHELGSAGRRSAVRLLQKLVADVDRVTASWAMDLDDGVRYVKRTVSLRKLPLLGPLLEAIGLAEFSIRDPVIRPRDKSLLFLNDLYREHQA